MKKHGLAFLIIMSMITQSWSQTLFTYGKYSVDVRDFLNAYNKNNSGAVTNKAESIRDYLELYIASRLKIREAYERGYDTLTQQKEEIANLRMQILENYMKDSVTLNNLVREAFKRSQKDIHIAHIFVGLRNQNGQIDTNAFKQKTNDIYRRLEKGEDFFTVAEQSSDDPSAKLNKGDIGYITVFSLPYEFENLVYSLPVNKFSSPYRSKAGYHIFKNLGERKAAGRIKAAQILLAIPPGSDETIKKEITQKADSLYRRLLAGDDFAKLATAYSNDYISASAGGIIPTFSVGQYNPEFENKVLGLRNGAISRPFLTSHGYHIVKRIGIQPIPATQKDKQFLQDLKLKVEQSDRIKITEDKLYDRVMKQVNFQKFPYQSTELWSLSDSLIDSKPLMMSLKINSETPLFKLGNKIVNVTDWITYAQAYRYKPDGSGLKPYNQVMEEFIRSMALQFYRDHLEDFNDEFRKQMAEFKEGNLFFEIMQREVWGQMQMDTIALIDFYNKHRDKYYWKPSADAVIFFSNDENTARLLYQQVKKNPSDWKNLSAALGEKVVADSSRFEWTQIPNAVKQKPLKGMITIPVVNKSDNSSSFAYILNVYLQPASRSFEEAKGLVMNDYQVEIEKKWVENLKKKYPVEVNEKVLQSIIK